MSGIKVGGSWKTPAITSVKVGGVWKTAATSYVKVGGAWKVSDLAGPPAVPNLTYTADNQYTITNYNSSLVYALTNSTRSGSVITVSSNTATITAAYAVGAPASAPRTMSTLPNERVLLYPGTGYGSTGCGPRGDICCPDGQIQNTAGAQCGGAPGTQGDFCDGACPGDCFGTFVTCYNWYWTNYTSAGYVLYGSHWGKAS